MKTWYLIFAVVLFCFGFQHGTMIAQSTLGYEKLIQQGKTQLEGGNVDLALASGEKAIELNSARWEAYALVGGALMNLKRYEDAADKLSEAIKRAPETKQAGLRDLRRQCLLAESQVSGSQKGAPPNTTTQAEIVLWKSIEKSSDANDFEAYLAKYPNGTFATLAKSHLDKIRTESAEEQSTRERTVRQNSGLEAARGITAGEKRYILLPSGNFFQVKKDQEVRNAEVVDANGTLILYGLPGNTVTIHKGQNLEISVAAVLDTFDGQPAIRFPVEYFCRSAMLYGQVNDCGGGHIIVSNDTVAYEKQKGQLEFANKRSSISIKIKEEGTWRAQGDSFSIYDSQGKRYRFGTEKFDSPFIMFLRTSIAEFPDVYKQALNLASKAQKPGDTSRGGTL